MVRSNAAHRSAKKKSKAKRWAKGQSSSSNPETTKYRDRVGNLWCKSTPTSSNLTVGALQLHNDACQEPVKGDEETAFEINDDQTTVTSFGRTQISKWSTCSLSAFNRFLNRFQVSSALHKQMLAILEAVAELVKTNGERESETEYFLALMTTLDAVTTIDEQVACMSLLNILIKRVPINILKVKFGELSKIFIHLLEQHHSSENSLLLKHLINCIAYLLHVQDLAEWQNSSMDELYRLILNFVAHPKPRVRRATKQAICFILKMIPVVHVGKPLKVHPAPKLTAKFCIQEMETYSPQTANHVLCFLNLLHAVIGYFPYDLLKTTCETILRLMTLGNVLITLSSLHVFQNLFASHATPENLSATLTQQLINALHSYVPSVNDSQPLVAWIKTMQLANLHMIKLDADVGRKLISHLFQEGAKIWLSESVEVQKAATQMLKALLYEVVQPLADVSPLPSADFTFILKLFSSIEGCLKFQYHTVWNQVLHVLAVFFEVSGKLDIKFMKKCLQTLSVLRESHHFSYVNELNYAIGMVVRIHGPEAVLSAVPLEFKASDSVEVGFRHSWLLPILRDNIRKTKMIFFIQHFLPLASACQSYSSQLSSEGKKIESSNYNLLYKQIWSLLPGFCTDPVDIVENFKSIAKTLGDNLKEHAELRLDILSALRLLIKRNLENDANKAELQRFAKNYVPIFFNLSTIEPEGSERFVRMAVLETLKVYLQITPTETVYLLFDEALNKLEDESCSSFKRHSILDLLLLMLQYVDEARLKKTFEISSKQTKSTDHTLIKKTYRLLEELCSNKTKACETFVKQHLNALKSLLFSLESGSPATKAVKMRTLTNIIRLFPSQEKIFAQFIPKVIICIVEPSQKAKMSAVALLEEMISSYMDSKAENSQQEILMKCVELMMAGLAVSPGMMSDTILAIGMVLRRFEKFVTDDLLQKIMKKVNLLLLSEEKQVVSSSVEFLKMLIPVVQEDSLAAHVETIVQNLLNLSNETRNFVYHKVKEVFAKLIKKFGYGMIVKFMSENHRRMLININKILERRKRKQAVKSLSQSESVKEDIVRGGKKQTIEELLKDSEDSEGDDDRSEGVPQSRRAWIFENSDQSIVNFLDPSSSRNIQATRPQEFEKRTKKDKAPFTLSSDGRLIITEPENEKETEVNVTNNNQCVLDDTNVITNSTTPKRKIDDVIDAEDDEPQAQKYQAGGLGIHRPVKHKLQKKLPGEDYRAKKAGGDTKKKGQPDPYAYIPLDRALLNRRTRVKGGKQYKRLIRAASTGARKGTKQHFQAKKRKKTSR